MLKLTLVFVGAGVGGVLRYLVGGVVDRFAGGAIPWGTLLVNVSGCFAMGYLAAAWAGPGREAHRLAVLVGVLGGYTTFSSFGRETLVLVERGAWGRAGVYVLASVILSLAAVWAGAAAAGGSVSGLTTGQGASKDLPTTTPGTGPGADRSHGEVKRLSRTAAEQGEGSRGRAGGRS